MNISRRNLIFFVIIVLINIIYDAKYQLHYDESYYWAFSQRLSLSYFDHPPMIAYMIKLGTIIFGHNEFAVRVTAIVTTCVTIITIFKLAYRMYGEKVANVGMFLVLCSPLFEAMFFITTPDSPFLMFWSLTLYFMYRGIFENLAKFIYIAGVTSGLGLLTKYTMILIFPSVFLFLVFSSQYRKLLLQKDLYLAFLISVVFFIPVVYWNYTHNWVSFIFQFNHGIDLKQKFNFGAFTDYLGGQLLICGVAIFLALLYFIIRNMKEILNDTKLAFLFWSFIFVLGFFGYRALFQHMEANWPASAYVSGIILIAVWVNKNNIKWVTKVSFALMVVVIIVTRFPLFLKIKSLHNRAEVSIVNAFFGNKELMDKARSFINMEYPVLACDYSNASRVWFYLNLKQVYVLDKFKYAHMYRYWNDKLPTKIKNATYVCDYMVCTSGDAECALYSKVYVPLEDYFTNVRFIESVTYDNPIGEKHLYIYNVSN